MLNDSFILKCGASDMPNSLCEILLPRFVECCCSSQAQIQKMKNAVPKNDKKKRKQMTEEIAKLEANLNQKHEEELTQFKSDNKVGVAD